jgi:hypothetical protein
LANFARFRELVGTNSYFFPLLKNRIDHYFVAFKLITNKVVAFKLVLTSNDSGSLQDEFLFLDHLFQLVRTGQYLQQTADAIYDASTDAATMAQFTASLIDLVALKQGIEEVYRSPRRTSTWFHVLQSGLQKAEQDNMPCDPFAISISMTTEELRAEETNQKLRIPHSLFRLFGGN